MYSQSDIEGAVAAGALSDEQASSLRDHVAASKSTPTPDEEYLRVLTGFNDVFSTVAIVFALIAAGMIGNLVPPHFMGGVSVFAGLFVAGVAWLLAEVFTLRRRMALPSIVLALAFVYALMFALAMMIITSFDPATLSGGGMIAFLGALCFALAGVGALLHWRRFRVPITVSLVVVLAVGVVAALVAAVTMPGPQEMMMRSYASPLSPFGRFGNVMQIVTVALGLVTFGYAMWWDGQDLERKTARSDVAFWLHAAAAGMIVHPLFSMLGLNIFLSMGGAVTVLLLYALFALVALIVDRRVLLITSLFYLLFALNALVRGSGQMGSRSLVTMLVVAGLLLTLALFWSALRARIVPLLPEALRARVPGGAEARDENPDQAY